MRLLEKRMPANNSLQKKLSFLHSKGLHLRKDSKFSYIVNCDEAEILDEFDVYKNRVTCLG